MVQYSKQNVFQATVVNFVHLVKLEHSNLIFRLEIVIHALINLKMQSTLREVQAQLNVLMIVIITRILAKTQNALTLLHSNLSKLVVCLNSLPLFV